MDAPLADASVDAVVSQESFCHIPDVKKALAEARRILKTGGRLAFTDWVAHQPLAAADAQLMWDGMAIQPLRSIPDYRHLVEGVGLRVLSVTDLTEEWRPIAQRTARHVPTAARGSEAVWNARGTRCISRVPTFDLSTSFNSASSAASEL